MKTVMFAFLLLISGCGTGSVLQKTSAMQFEQVQQFVLGGTSESEIVTKLGVPATRVEKDGYYILSYNDSRTGVQRLSLNIGSASQKLISLLWIPQEEEPEFNLVEAKSRFQNAKFTETKEDTSSPHALSSITLFRDDKAGITIRYNHLRQYVEAIAKFNTTERVPATIPKPKENRYTIGDEPSADR